MNEWLRLVPASAGAGVRGGLHALRTRDYCSAVSSTSNQLLILCGRWAGCFLPRVGSIVRLSLGKLS